jgi:two-component system KDP operon response regulator KdpE
MKDRRNRYKVLIIDDEPQIRRLIRIALEANDYEVFEEANGKDGQLSLVMNHPDLVLLDLGLPDMDGISILKKFREWSQVPVIVLTVQDVVYTKVLALDSGADDYITKPFNTSELLARIRVAIRHSFRMDESPVFHCSHLFVDLNARVVKVNNEEIKLTATEYSLLALFVKHAGKVLTHSFVMNEIWGKMYAENFQTLRVHIAQLRKKIEINPSMPELLISEPGVGYRFRDVD